MLLLNLLFLIVAVVVVVASDPVRNTVTVEKIGGGGANPVIVTTNPLEQFQFTQQPVDRTVQKGDSVTMRCEVATVGSASYSYQWHKFSDLTTVMSDSTRIAGALSSTLEIAAVEPWQAGYYQCVAGILGTNHTIFSNTGKLIVEHFDFDPATDTLRDRIRVQENTDFVALSCDIPDSSPEPEISWYKGWAEPMERVVDLQKAFVLPADSDRDFGHSIIKKGSLIIMYVDKSDVSRYKCKAEYKGEEYLLAQWELRLEGEVQTSPVINARFVIHTNAEAVEGQSAEFYCSGIGKPPPVITWTKSDGSRIETSEKYQLQDLKRRLVVTNVEMTDVGQYYCNIKVEDLQARSQIKYLSMLPSTNKIEFVTAPSPHLIYTNWYPQFTLRCAIDYSPFKNRDGSVVLYWMKDGKQLAISRRMERLPVTENTEKQTLESTIVIVTPNESDLGVYQCMAKNAEMIRQVTTAVNIRVKSPEYNSTDSGSPVYDVVKLNLKVDEAEEYCAEWDPSGHLVSLMSEEEVKIVTTLLKKEGITKSWIGLNSEQTSGDWRWTQGADDSQTFSYWYSDSPDNLYGREEYAVMDTDLGGRWLDVLKKETHPFVCKRYDNKCPSIREYYEGKLEPLNRVESKGTEYGVGETITVTCRDRTVPLKEILTCTQSGDYSPRDAFACPIYSSSRHSVTLASAALLTVLLLGSFL